jgi:hypothetical protein
LAVGELLRRKVHDTSSVTNALQPLQDPTLSVKLKIATIGVLLLGMDAEEVDLALKAVEIRNKIVHKGADATPKNSKELDALLKLVGMMLPGTVTRFPGRMRGGGMWATPEGWEKSYEKGK